MECKVEREAKDVGFETGLTEFKCRLDTLFWLSVAIGHIRALVLGLGLNPDSTTNELCDLRQIA